MKSTESKIVLEPIDRGNYRALFRMQLRPGQENFVTPPRWTLARCYVRMFGDNFEHLPHLIRAEGKVVGYCTTVCDAASEEEYWIDDIMIDADASEKRLRTRRDARYDRDDRGALSAMPCRAANLFPRQPQRSGAIQEPRLRANGRQ